MIACWIVLLTTAPAQKQRVAVLDFQATGVEARFAETYTQLVAAALSQTGRFEAVRREDIAALLGVEEQKQLMRVSDASGLDRVSAMLDARHVVTGTIGKAVGGFMASAQLIDVSKGQVLVRAVQRAASLNALSTLASRLARDLAAEPAVLAIYNQPPGVAVFLDDKPIVVTPLAPTSVAATGRHRLRAESGEHVPWEAEIDLEPGRATRVRLALERVEELMAKSRARKVWGGVAIGGAVVAAAGAAVALRFGVLAKQEYDGSDLLLVTQAELDARANRARTLLGVGGAAVGVAALAAAAGIYLLVTDPFKKRLESLDGKVALAPALSPTGAGLVLSGSF